MAERKIEGVSLIDHQTGEIGEAWFKSKKRGKGEFMKVWQGGKWDDRLEGLQGASLKVLWWLVRRAEFQNRVMGPAAAARGMGKARQAVERAYRELVKGYFLEKDGGAYRLNPHFCWRGTDGQHDEVCRQEVERKRDELSMLKMSERMQGGEVRSQELREAVCGVQKQGVDKA